MRSARCVIPTMCGVLPECTMVPMPPVGGGHGERRIGRRHAMHAYVGKVALGLGLGLVVMLGIIAPRASVIAQQESPMTVAETQGTLEAYFTALLGGGAYETSFADDLVVTMTGVPGEITGPAAAKTAI